MQTKFISVTIFLVLPLSILAVYFPGLSGGFVLDDLIGLEEQIIPYYRLRIRSENRRGSEEALLKGLENGYFKYSLMLFRKR